MYSECQCLATVALLHSTLPTAKPEACSLSHAVLAHVKVPPKMTYISGYAGPEPSLSLSLDSPILFVGSLSKNTVSSPAFCKGETASNHNIKHHRDHTHAHTHAPTCTYTHAHTRTHAHIRTHMHAHTHTHTRVHTCTQDLVVVTKYTHVMVEQECYVY